MQTKNLEPITTFKFNAYHETKRQDESENVFWRMSTISDITLFKIV